MELHRFNTADRAAFFLESHGFYSVVLGEGAKKSMRDKLAKRFGITKWEAGNMGYSESKKTWYGYSHRAIAGFKVGSKVMKGDVLADADGIGVGFEAKSEDDAKKMAYAFAREVA